MALSQTELDQMLIDAAGRGNNSRVEEALRLGANIHVKNDDPLHYAVRHGHKETMLLLVAHGADIHAANDHALRMAAESGYQEIVEWLLEPGRGTNVHGFRDLPLRDAAHNGHTEIVGLLLDHGADIHAESDVALVSAAKNGHKDTVALLLDHSADIHAQDDLALYWSAAHGYAKMAMLLLERSADIHAGNDRALHAAIGNYDVDMAFLLLRYGADPKAKDSAGKDAFEDSQLAEWLGELKRQTAAHFQPRKPSRKQCFSMHAGGNPTLHERVLDACITTQFVTLIGMPLIASTDKSDRQLFQDIWDALPQHWQDQHQNLYMQFIKEGGVNPIIGSHTAVTHRNTLPPDKLAGR